MENAVTTVTEMAMTKAGCSLAVTAKAEQIPNTCTVTGLSAPKGRVRSFMFLDENISFQKGTEASAVFAFS